MARKVIDVTRSVDKYDILSQTPNNYNSQNYYLKELQDKVNAEWNYRPNRVTVEYEHIWGSQQYSPLEVVVQTVKSEKGTVISDDCKSLVFRDISEDRFKIGSKFRFAPNFNNRADQVLGVDIKKNVDDIDEYEDVYMENDGTLVEDLIPVKYRTNIKYKNVWLVTNTNTAKMTSNVIIQRCNGTLGSTYKDSQGISHRHYEPVIQGQDVSSTALRYSETAVLPQSQLLIICQHNETTKNYFINQRFIIGYDKVYRITAINKFYSNSTYDPENVGLMRIYLELTEASPYDDFKKRIAYQKTPEVIIDTDDNLAALSIKFTKPDKIPTTLTEEPITFVPVLYDEDTKKEYNGSKVELEYVLENLPESIDPSIYINCQDNGDNTFTLSRKRIYLNGSLKLTFKVLATNSPSGEDISVTFTMLTRG